MQGLRLPRNEDRTSDQVSNILVGLPNLPQLGSTRPFGLGVGVNQSNCFSYTCPTPPLLVLPLSEVVMMMDDICNPRPMLLNILEFA